jgi:hypothetical protein
MKHIVSNLRKLGFSLPQIREGLKVVYPEQKIPNDETIRRWSSVCGENYPLKEDDIKKVIEAVGPPKKNYDIKKVRQSILKYCKSSPKTLSYLCQEICKWHKVPKKAVIDELRVLNSMKKIIVSTSSRRRKKRYATEDYAGKIVEIGKQRISFLERGGITNTILEIIAESEYALCIDNIHERLLKRNINMEKNCLSMYLSNIMKSHKYIMRNEIGNKYYYYDDIPKFEKTKKEWRILAKKDEYTIISTALDGRVRLLRMLTEDAGKALKKDISSGRVVKILERFGHLKYSIDYRDGKAIIKPHENENVPLCEDLILARQGKYLFSWSQRNAPLQKVVPELELILSEIVGKKQRGWLTESEVRSVMKKWVKNFFNNGAEIVGEITRQERDKRKKHGKRADCGAKLKFHDGFKYWKNPILLVSSQDRTIIRQDIEEVIRYLSKADYSELRIGLVLGTSYTPSIMYWIDLPDKPIKIFLKTYEEYQDEAGVVFKKEGKRIVITDVDDIPVGDLDKMRVEFKYLDDYSVENFPLLVQPKYDGQYTIVRKSNGWTFMASGGPKELPELEQELDKIFKSDVLILGELYAADEYGHPNLDLLRKIMSSKDKKGRESLRLAVFDLVYYDGHDYRWDPLRVRLNALQELLSDEGKIHIIKWFECLSSQEVKERHDYFVGKGFEGIVAKKKDDHIPCLGLPYIVWYKTKPFLDIDCLFFAWRKHKKGCSLLVGLSKGDGKYIPIVCKAGYEFKEEKFEVEYGEDEWKIVKREHVLKVQGKLRRKGMKRFLQNIRLYKTNPIRDDKKPIHEDIRADQLPADVELPKTKNIPRSLINFFF